MNACKKYQHMFIEAFYAELPEQKRNEMEAHLDRCPSCSKEFMEMRETLDIMSRRDETAPGQPFWDNYWLRLDKRLKNQAGAAKQGRVLPLSNSANVHKWTLRILSAAALFMAGFGGGYLYLSRQHTPQVAVYEPASENNPLMLKTANYLEESKVLLLGIVNLDAGDVDPSGLDFSSRQERSGELMRQAVSLKDELRHSGDRRLLNLISELEMILLQITNYEEKFDAPAIELIRGGVENQALLMKINMEQLLISARDSKQEKQPSKKGTEL